MVEIKELENEIKELKEQINTVNIADDLIKLTGLNRIEKLEEVLREVFPLVRSLILRVKDYASYKKDTRWHLRSCEDVDKLDELLEKLEGIYICSDCGKSFEPYYDDDGLIVKICPICYVILNTTGLGSKEPEPKRRSLNGKKMNYNINYLNIGELIRFKDDLLKSKRINESESDIITNYLTLLMGEED